LFSELSDNFSIAVRFQKSRRQRQPLSTRYDPHHVEQEDEQIVRLAGSPRERFFVDDFKINQSCAVAARIVDYILGSAIAVRPAATEIVAPKLMSPAKFSTCGPQYSACERAAIQVYP